MEWVNKLPVLEKKNLGIFDFFNQLLTDCVDTGYVRIPPMTILCLLSQQVWCPQVSSNVTPQGIYCYVRPICKFRNFVTEMHFLFLICLLPGSSASCSLVASDMKSCHSNIHQHQIGLKFICFNLWPITYLCLYSFWKIKISKLRSENHGILKFSGDVTLGSKKNYFLPRYEKDIFLNQGRGSHIQEPLNTSCGMWAFSVTIKSLSFFILCP